MLSTDAAQLLQRSEDLLRAIAQRDWPAYEQLCAPSLTAFEPEARGHLVSGLGFHRYYFDNAPAQQGGVSTIVGPHIRVMGDVGLVCYVRLVQQRDADGTFRTTAFEETRVWQRIDGQWRHVHFHRSANGQ
jgi:calcium/calmodulin-dependent protein kinase (CaM kinase) II